jgi:hypothetical protein
VVGVRVIRTVLSVVHGFAKNRTQVHFLYYFGKGRLLVDRPAAWKWQQIDLTIACSGSPTPNGVADKGDVTGACALAPAPQ